MLRVKVGEHKLYACPHCKGMLRVWVAPGPRGPMEMPCSICSKIFEVWREV